MPAGRAPRFPLLDSIRAIAALSVVVFHAGFWSRVTETGSVAAPFLTHLDVGVTVFFVLSGFLLYRPFVRARLLGGPAPSAAAYGWRRALRIVPAFWVALTLIALWVPKPDTFEPSHAVVYYGFAQIYTDLALGGIGQAWTLCVEVTFYAMLPLWAVLLRRLPGGVRTEVLGLLALALAATAWNAGWAFSNADTDHANTARALIWLPAFLDHFALGMALAVASVVAERDGALPRAVAWVAVRPWLAWTGRRGGLPARLARDRAAVGEPSRRADGRVADARPPLALRRGRGRRSSSRRRSGRPARERSGGCSRIARCSGSASSPTACTSGTTR